MQDKFAQVGKLIEKKVCNPILESAPCMRISLKTSIWMTFRPNVSMIRNAVNHDLAMYVSGGEWTSLSQQKER
jgi:hypothetical protein